MNGIIDLDRKYHRKTISATIYPTLKIARQGHSVTSATSPETPQIAQSFSLNSPTKLNDSSFLKVLDASLSYFSQVPITSSLNFPSLNVEKLQQEKEKLKIENSKLQLSLAQAKAKVLVYKGKVKSLKNYCKIMEVNNLSKISKDFMNEGRKKEKRRTLTDVSGFKFMDSKSSDTEFDCN